MMENMTCSRVTIPTSSPHCTLLPGCELCLAIPNSWPGWDSVDVLLSPIIAKTPWQKLCKHGRVILTHSLQVSVSQLGRHGGRRLRQQRDGWFASFFFYCSLGPQPIGIGLLTLKPNLKTFGCAKRHVLSSWQWTLDTTWATGHKNKTKSKQQQ